MLSLTNRQSKILNSVAEEYIEMKKPISSKLLARKRHFGIKPAMLRIEMQKLTDMGYLKQPHTSAGRIPTDKGYRFYVDNLFTRRNFVEQNLGGREKKSKGGLNPIEKEIDDSFRFFRDLTKKMAELTSNLALSYFPEEDIFFKEGWDNLFKEPEFENTDLASRFAEMVENMEKNINELENFDLPQIFIGKENPICGSREFSVIISKIHLPRKKEGVVALMGPKRMDYDKNVKIINSLVKENVREKTRRK